MYNMVEPAVRIPAVNIVVPGVGNIYGYPIFLSNIEKGGRHSADHGFTYQRLAEIANDRHMLTHSMGNILGNIVYALPTRIKAGTYVKHAQECAEKGLIWKSFLIICGDTGDTVGVISLTEIEKELYNLPAEYANMRLMNVGVMIRTPYQNRGVVSTINREIFEKPEILETFGVHSVDGLFVATRPDNASVKHIASKMGFELIGITPRSLELKRVVRESRILPIPISVMYDVYVKRFQLK